MCKAAGSEPGYLGAQAGGRLVTVIVEGDVADVKAAVEAAASTAQECHHILAASGVIAAPCEETLKMVARSEKRLAKKKEQ